MSIVIGLTGPTGAGKGAVARLFSAHGAAVIDADLEARAVVERGSRCLEALTDAFGREILQQDGSLNRARLGDLVFTDRAKLERMNGITHPFIMQRISDALCRCRQEDAPLIVLDAPTLFETGADRFCDCVVAVTAPRALRRARIIERDGLTPERADHRIQSQQDDAFYTGRSDFVITNESDLASLERQVAQTLEQLQCKTFGRAARSEP